MRTRILSLVFISLLLTGCGETAEPVAVTENAAKDYQVEEKEVMETRENATETTETEQTTEHTTENKQEELTGLEVHYIDVGQADATFFRHEADGEEFTMLYDAGDWRGNEVVPYLKNQGVTELDVVAASHPDADHIGQLGHVLQTFDVGELWLSGNVSESETFQRAMNAALATGAILEEPRIGEEYTIGDLDISVIYPETITGDSNQESLSFIMNYGDIGFAFTGDAETANEQEMIANGLNLEAEILQLGHHGSDTSTSAAFLDAVNPEVAIYSAGADNSYGHPSVSVTERVTQAGIDLYGTDTHGTIIVTTDGVTYDVETGREMPAGSDTAAPVSEKESVKETETAPSNNACVDVNSASLEEVQQIIHIGPERASDLINGRPYGSIDDLSQISGIGTARLADITEQRIACVN